MAWALDLDGVVWLGDRAVPGAAGAVARLQKAGEQVLFVTNNSGRTVAEVEARLAGFGIDACGGVVTSAMAAARLVEPGETGFNLGDGTTRVVGHEEHLLAGLLETGYCPGGPGHGAVS